MTIKIPRRISADFPAGGFFPPRRRRRRPARRHRDALSQPRRRPPANHPWRAIRRRRRRRRRGVGARGPAVADAGRGRHHGIVSQCAGFAADRGTARERLHRQRCCWKICPPGRIFFIASDSATCRIPTLPASRSSAASAPRRRPARRQFRLGRRCRRTGLGHQSRRRRHASPSPPCASTGRISCSIPATPSMPTASFPPR